MAKTTTPKNAKTEEPKLAKIPTVPCNVLVTAVGVGVTLRKGKVADVPVPLVAGLVKCGYIKDPGDSGNAENADPPGIQRDTGGTEKRAPTGKQFKAKGEETR